MKSAGSNLKFVGFIPSVKSRGRYPVWVAAALFLVAVIVTPYIPLVVSLFSGGGESWDHVRTTVLGRYTANTIFLVGGATLGASVIGVAGAWILERYRLPIPRVLELAFVAPLALPVYIGTFTWNGIFAFRGPIDRALGINVPFGGIWAAIFILVIGLYPYVYLTTRAALMSNSRVLFEVVASLSGGVPRSRGIPESGVASEDALKGDGAGTTMPSGRMRPGSRRHYWRRLWSGVIPSLRPAIVGGASLVAMETMNAYATPVFLGVETLSTGVFRTWFGLGDLPTATLLAAIVLMAMLTLIAVEQYGRGRRRYTTAGGAPPQRVPLPRWGTALLVGVLLLPALLCFFIPMAQLTWWTVLAGGEGLTGIGVTTARTVSLALAATFVILSVAVLLNLVAYLRPGWMMNGVLRIAGIGYAVPGTVVAIGVLAVFQ
ncbi:MAG: hypothetical protein R6U25_08570, partial [Alkalispirochaeta sp.]